MSSSSFPSDLAISRKANLRAIQDVAADLGLEHSDLLFYGTTKAKIKLSVLDDPRFRDRPNGRYIDVTAITPTPLGEGKTTTLIGLTQALGKLGKKTACCIRQPSMGPTFGIKGGAAGGGYAQVVPMEEFNLHLTGDIHAISVAHNLASAAIDARLYHESRMSDVALEKLGLKRLNIDPYNITWPRVVDVNDRSLRHITLGLGGVLDGIPREGGYDIAVASELMAIIALASDLKDLRKRVGRIVFGLNRAGQPLTLEDLQVAGAVTVLLRDALLPNLMQTLEGQPALVHAGPFANVAHGNSSIVADRIALKLADYVLTESGFGSDIGMEKFVHVKCRTSGIVPDAVVLVATVRALKTHGNGPPVVAGRALDVAYTQENLPLLREGLPNLIRHIEIARKFGIPVVVAINRFHTDTEAEIAVIREAALAAGAYDAIPTTHFTDGGAGSVDLAQAVMKAAERPKQFRYLYPLELGIAEKIAIVAREVYGAKGIALDQKAQKQIARYEAAGFGNLPICVAKTHLSLSHDPTLKGVPHDFIFPIREVRAAVGAGFIYPIAGDMRTMPGLGAKPAYMQVDIDENGEVVGLF
ncbi:MAG: formate--tetrahydrofolate ligase [Rhodothermia bacterium]|nr:formate--tetrahydrofolate ligase [Rhodothermia bacterium]